MNEILKKISQRAAPIWGVSEESLNPNTTFEEMKAKSAHISQITTYLEDEFDVEVPFMGFRRCKTLGEAAQFVAALLEE